MQADSFMELRQLAKKEEVPMQPVPIEKLNRITKANHQGVIALISPIPYHNIEQVLPSIFEVGKEPFILVLDGVTDVRNFGAIARTAECAGVHALVIPARGSADINSDAVKASAGALNRIKVCRSKNLVQTVRYLKESGLSLLGASEKASDEYRSIEGGRPLALIMGSEGEGMSKEIMSELDQEIKITMPGELASLNVGVACGIILFEIVHQRHSRGK